MNHYLKIDQKWYAPLSDGRKLCEIRLNDRDYQVGDHLIFNKIVMKNGEEESLKDSHLMRFKIVHVLHGCQGLSENYVALSMFRFRPEVHRSESDIENDEEFKKDQEFYRELEEGAETLSPKK